MKPAFLLTIIRIAMVTVLLHAPAMAESAAPLERLHRGIHLVAPPAKPGRTFDTSLLSPAQGLDNIAAALDRLIDGSPRSAQALDLLQRNGRIVVIYYPDDLGRYSDGEKIALYLPEFRRDAEVGNGRGQTFRALVGRHGVKWPVDELAAVLAHELVGHAMQDHRKRIRKARALDMECEAYLYEETAYQDLGLAKHSADMVAWRQALERHWCADFKRYMRDSRPGDLALWDKLNPDIAALLAIFETYLDHQDRTSVNARAAAALRGQIREDRARALRYAHPAEIHRAAVALRDGGIGVPPDPAEAWRYFRIAAERGYAPARQLFDNAPVRNTAAPQPQ